MAFGFEIASTVLLCISFAGAMLVTLSTSVLDPKLKPPPPGESRKRWADILCLTHPKCFKWGLVLLIGGFYFQLISA
jgi:hypothetical protein